MADGELNLRMTLVAPPAGVVFSLQDAKNHPVDPVMSTGADLSLDLSIRVAPGPDGPRFLGPFVRREGPRRFAYFAVGEQAGQQGSCWSRRGKVWLDTFAAGQVASAVASGVRLEARFQGTGRDGGPACASVKPLDGWRPV